MHDRTRDIAGIASQLEALDSSKRFSALELEAIYALAYNLYNGGRYDQAVNYFGLLTLYRPTDPKFLLGLASAQQMARQFEAAIQTYAFITLLDPSDPTPTLRIGECLMHLGQVDDARDSLKMVVAVAGAGGAHADAKSRAEGLLDLLGKSKSASAATA